MKTYLLDFFKYNNWANKKLIDCIKQIPDKTEAVKLFTHLISAPTKWLNRVTKENDDKDYLWFAAPVDIEEIRPKIQEITDKWMDYISKLDEAELNNEVVFERPNDGKKFSLKLIDLVLQINYHSIYHRAQIARIIRQQGVTPPATDYIFTVIKEV